MNNRNIITIGVLIISLISLILNKAITKGKFTCKNYILNLYLYLSLAISLLAFTTIILEKVKINSSIYKKLIFASFLVCIICIFSIYLVENIYISHFIWLLFIISIGMSFLPIVNILKENNDFVKTLVTVTVLVLLLTALAFYKPEYISLNWGNFLIVALIVGIIIRFIQLLIGEPTSKFNLLLSYAFVLLFSFYLLYDTKLQQIKALKCQDLVNNFKIYPNYPRESLGIFLDIINLFSNIGRINSSK